MFVCGCEVEMLWVGVLTVGVVECYVHIIHKHLLTYVTPPPMLVYCRTRCGCSWSSWTHALTAS